MIRKEFFGLKRVRALWTNSKFVVSTGGVTLEALKEYTQNIENQLAFF